ncbi:MAG: mannitol dehydrogenase family protein [Actinomycetota bacterium]|nr:mannitol dehydrogenase family protein [Actinomycetota bacterium]
MHPQQRHAPAVALSAATLGQLPSRVGVPEYDRSGLTPSIVHIGVGGFHRAHQAVYLDDLCSRGLQDWAITGAGVLAGDLAMARALRAQDGLYTLLVRDTDSSHARVIGSIVDDLHGPSRPDELAARVADPATRIVSLTVTEGGYPVDPHDGSFAPPADGAPLPAAFELIARACATRRARGDGPFTVMSCDNVISNGEVARTATLGVARLIDEDLAAWIDEHVAFPNCMVDRITPATSDADRDMVEAEFGILDRVPVMTEPFTQWVLEDTFAAGRPPWEDVGVMITGDVEPYELLKLRLLNASHSSFAYLSAIAGYELVHDVMADPAFRRFVDRFLDTEAAPALPPIPGIDVEAYKRQLVERFSNVAIRDQVARLCLDGSAKFPKFLMPTVRIQLERGGPVALSALALAGWAHYLAGRDDAGRGLTIASDPGLDEARRHALAATEDPAAFLGFRSVFDPAIATDERFREAFVSALSAIQRNGVQSTLERWLDEGAGSG